MGMFGKRGADIDFTLMHKKGLLKLPERKSNDGIKINSQGLIDFSGVGVQESSNSRGIVQEQGAVSPFGFLDSLAGSSSSSGLENSMKNPNLEVDALKIKVDDLDFKIGQLMEKLASIEIKLYNFERKVGQ